MKRLALAAVIALVGCENHTGEIWRAQREMPVYKSSEGDAQEEIFRLAPGDICYPGKVVTEKVFQYTQVRCPPKGEGWVADDYFHKEQGK